MSRETSSSSSSPRPVGRRESPWGISEGDHRQPKPHRCNDRAEDVIQACFEGNPFKTVPGLSSSSGIACAQNLGKNQQSHSSICNWICQREK